MFIFYVAFVAAIEFTIVHTNDLPIGPAVEQVEGTPK